MSGNFDDLLRDVHERMDKVKINLKKEFAGLRSGRATPALLEPVRVEAYGSLSPLSQVASIAVPEPSMLSVSVWDKGLVQAVEKAIRTSGLGLNPASEGQTVRVPVPQLTGERREELAKAAGRYTENARIAVRNVRRDGMHKAKQEEKEGEISEDELKNWVDSIQKLTDSFISDLDEMLSKKESEIKQV